MFTENHFCDNDDGYRKCISGYSQYFINCHIFVCINIALFLTIYLPVKSENETSNRKMLNRKLGISK